MKDKIVGLIIDKIKKDYKDDIDLLVSYGSKEGVALYFVPNNEEGKKLSFQFVIENNGYDLFPIPWERMTSIVAFDTPITYVIGNSEVLYSRNDEVLARFNGLKDGLNTFVSAGPSEALLNKAYEYLNDAYVNLYNINLRSSDLLDKRVEATKIIGKIAQSVGYANATYYKEGIRHGVKESYGLELLPEKYQELVEASINSTTKEEVTKNIEALLIETRKFLKELMIGHADVSSYDHMIGYYEEWKKLIVQMDAAIKEDNQEELFMIVGFFVEETAQFLTAADSGVWYNDRNVFSEYSSSTDEMYNQDLFDLVIKRDYVGLKNAIKVFEERFKARLSANGIEFAEFDTVEEFEKALNEK